MLAAALAALISFVGTNAAGADDAAGETAPDVTLPQADEPQADEPAGEGAPAEEAPAEEAPAAEAPAEEAPAEEAPAEEAPAEEAPAEEAPAEEPAPADELIVDVRAGQDVAWLSFSAGVESGAMVVVGESSDYDRAITVREPALDHTVVIDGLECERVYNAAAFAMIGGGIALHSDDLEIRTLPCSIADEDVAPLSVLAYSDYAIVTWGTPEPSKGMAIFGVDETYGNAAVEPHYSTFHQVYLVDLDCDTTYQFRTVSEHADGETVWGDNQSFTTYACDPIVDSVDIELDATGAQMVIATDEPAEIAVIYGLTRAYGSEARSNGVGVDHRLSLPNLACEAEYNYRIIAFLEGSERPEWSPQNTFVTGPCDAPEPEAPAVEEPVAEEPGREEPATDEPATDEPVAEEPAREEPAADEPTAEEPAREEPAALEIGDVYVSHITKDEVQINWSTNHAARGSIVWGTTPALGSELVSGTVADSHVLSLTDLECETEYHFAVLAGGGEHSVQWSQRQSVVTADCGSATISNINVDGDADSLTISWNTDIETTGLVIYGADFNYGSATIGAGDGLFHRASIADLDCGSTYHMRIAAETPDGLYSWTKDIAASTAECSGGTEVVPPTEDGRQG